MTIDQILALRSELSCYLEQFADCFGRIEPRLHLRHYLRGQLSDLPRKSVEPIALFNNVAPRTLQEFLASDAWDHEKLRDRTQEVFCFSDRFAGITLYAAVRCGLVLA